MLSSARNDPIHVSVNSLKRAIWPCIIAEDRRAFSCVAKDFGIHEYDQLTVGPYDSGINDSLHIAYASAVVVSYTATSID